MDFCIPCIHSDNSSHLIKKSSNVHKYEKSIQSKSRFQRIKGTNIIREINPIIECNFTKNNSDMSAFHDDTQITLLHRQSKNMPRWARKSQIQLEYINQVYFNDKNPDEIFGSIKMNLAHEMVQSIDLYSSPSLPPNFV